MSIFNKKFEDIDFSDIMYLVENKVQESQVLEYKEKYNNNQTDKLISAFANTHGGFIVYGIKENEKNNEPEEIVNIEDDNLENTIDSVCYDSIEPFISCKSKYLENDEKTKRVFIVKVSESDLTPHAIDNNSTVYIKVNAQKRKIEKATLEHQEWLKNKRAKRVSLREELIKLLEDDYGFPELKANDIKYNLNVLVYPLYPKRFVEIQDFYKIVKNSIDDFRTKHPHSVINYTSTKNYNGGLFTDYKDSKIHLLINFNINGLIHFSIITNKSDTTVERINVDQIVLYLLTAMKLAQIYLKKIGCLGSIGIRSSINNIFETKLTFEYSDGSSFNMLANSQCKTENILPVTKEYTSLNIENLRNYIILFISELLFVYNVNENIYDLSENMYRRGVILYKG